MAPSVSTLSWVTRVPSTSASNSRMGFAGDVDDVGVEVLGLASMGGC
jgi:hypothetical protein